MIQLASYLTLPLGDGESASSFCSRVARNIGVNAWDFARQMGTNLQAIFMGKPGAMENLSAVTQAPLEELRHNTPTDAGHFRLSMFGEVFSTDLLDRRQLRICPICAAEDVEGRDSDPAVSHFGRSVWLPTVLTVCHRHNVVLPTVHVANRQSEVFDYSRNAARFLGELPRLRATLVERRPSHLEEYIFRRLGGSAESTPLIKMPLYAAIKLSQAVGVLAEHGPSRHWSTLSEAEKVHCGSTGFDLIETGQKLIGEFLDRMRDAFIGRTGPYSLAAIYGRLYLWLNATPREEVYDEFREVMRNRMIETLPVGPPDEIFGRRVEHRLIHSARSLSLQTAVEVNTLRCGLQVAGLIAAATRTLSSSRVLFPAAPGESVAATMRATGVGVQAAHRLGCRPALATRLLAEGVIDTAPATASPKDRLFRSKEVDDFLKRLAQIADPDIADRGDLMPLLQAADLAWQDPFDAISMILSGKVQSVGFDRQGFGLAAILVDPAELRPELMGPENDMVPVTLAARIMGVTPMVLGALCVRQRAAVLKTKQHNYYRPEGIEAVSLRDLKALRTSFVTMHAFSRETGIHFLELENRLKEAGIRPAFDIPVAHSRYFHRSEVLAFMSTVPPPGN